MRAACDLRCHQSPDAKHPMARTSTSQTTKSSPRPPRHSASNVRHCSASPQQHYSSPSKPTFELSYHDRPGLTLSELENEYEHDDHLTVLFDDASEHAPLPYDQWYEAKSIAIESQLVRDRQDAMRHALMVRFKRYQADRAFEQWASQKDNEAQQLEMQQRELDMLHAQESRMLELKRNETFRAWLSRKDRQLEIERLQKNDNAAYMKQHTRSEQETDAKFAEWCRRKDAHTKREAKAQEKKQAEKAAKIVKEKADRTQRGQELYAEWTRNKNKAERKQAAIRASAVAKETKIKQDRKDRFDKEFSSMVTEYTSKIQGWKRAEADARKKQELKDRPQRAHRSVAASDKPKPKISSSSSRSKSDKQQRISVRPAWIDICDAANDL